MLALFSRVVAPSLADIGKLRLGGDGAMTNNVLHHVSNTARDAESAWTAASSAGASALHSAFSALQTLIAQAMPSAPPAAPNRLLSAQHAFEADLQQLKTTLRRLTSIVNGLKRWQDELRTTESYPALRRAFDDLLLRFELDLHSKRDVLHSVVHPDVVCLSVADWTRCIALWSEQPHRLGSCGHDVAAIAIAEQVMQSSNSMPDAQLRRTHDSPAASTSLSPAMLALKQRLTKTSPKS
ncbi:unnamed protein product [Agarophyton chilense]